MNNVLQDKLLQNYIDLTTEEMPEGFQFMNSDASEIFSVCLTKQTAKKYDEIWNNI